MWILPLGAAGIQNKINLYAYSNNDPINHSDPTGLSAYRDSGVWQGIDGSFEDDGVCHSPEVACTGVNPWRLVALSDDSNGAPSSEKSTHLSFKSKLSRNFKWFTESISGSLGGRVGLNAKVKVFKIIKLRLGTGYWGMTGHLNLHLDGRDTFDERGPSAALEVGRFAVGYEGGGYETNTLTGEVKTLDGFTGYKYFGDKEWAANKTDLSVEANVLIIHASLKANLTGMFTSIFYWGDSTLDPND